MIIRLPYARTGYFSRIVLDYLQGEEYLKPFYGLPPVVESFGKQLDRKGAQFSHQNREVLHRALVRQHRQLKEVRPEVQQNIDKLLRPDAFTVVTGHQLCLFTGPLYFIYKIISTIKACKELQERFPERQFVPVFWMASEDHDFAEVDHFRFQEQTYRWRTEQKGAVGKFDLEGIKDLLQQLPEHLPLLEEPYRQHHNLADATRELVHRLFGQYGLVCIDGDDAELKQLLVPVLEQELLEGVSQRKVHEVTERLAAYHKMQVTSRPINLFYLADGVRERIEREGEEWQVLNTSIRFNQEELLQEVRNHPERFSPNVILRPLYQELILPNLAYIGGGAEVAYWMQLPRVFEHFGVPMPVLMLRNSALYIPASLHKRLEKLQLTPVDLFRPQEELKKHVLQGEETYHEVQLQEQQNTLKALYTRLQQQATEIDPTLAKAVAAAEHRALKGLQMLEKKLNRAVERTFETRLHQLHDLLSRLFPNGVLQERQDNVSTFLVRNSRFVEDMMEALEPFRPEFTIVKEEV